MTLTGKLPLPFVSVTIVIIITIRIVIDEFSKTLSKKTENLKGATLTVSHKAPRSQHMNKMSAAAA